MESLNTEANTNLNGHNIENLPMPKRLLSVEETASYLGISERTIYNQVCRNAKKRFPITPKRIGKRILFDIKDIENYVDSL
jgi:predicted DNA-binding transcriptional regulator AlpA